MIPGRFRAAREIWRPVDARRDHRRRAPTCIGTFYSVPELGHMVHQTATDDVMAATDEATGSRGEPFEAVSASQQRDAGARSAWNQPIGFVVEAHQPEGAEMKTLQNLFEDGLRDIYYAEQKILDALSKMADAAVAEQAVKAFRLHRDQTEGQIQRLEQVFDLIGQTSSGKPCPAIDGL